MPQPQETTDPNSRAFERALTTLKSAVGTLKLYPRESPICQQVLHTVHEPIQNFLKTAEQVSVNDTGTGLTMDGSKPIQVKGFRELLLPHKIRNVKFIRGVNALEVSTLCEGLGKKKEELGAVPNFNAWLAAKGVKYIQTDEIRYIDILDNERVVIRGMGEISGTPGESGGIANSNSEGRGRSPGTEEDGSIGSGDPGFQGGRAGNTSSLNLGGGASVIQVVQQTLQQISSMPDAALQGALRDSLVSDLAQMAPEKLQDLFTSPEAGQGPMSDVVQDLVQNLPLQKIEDILRYVAEQHQQVKVQIQSESDRAQRLNLLNTFIRQVMNAPASRELSPEMYSYLSTLGLLEHVPGGSLKGGQYFSFTAVAKNLMEVPVHLLVTAPLRDHLLDLVKNLSAGEPDETLPRLIERVLENLDSFDDALRNHTVTTLGKLHGVVSSGGQVELAELLREKLLASAGAERNLEVYKSTAAALLNVAMADLLQWQYNAVAKILALYRRHSLESFAIPQGRFEQARRLVHDFAQRSADSLCADLALPEHQSGALQVLAQLSEEATESLLATLRRSPNPRTQQAVLQALEAVGIGRQKILLEQLQVGAGPKELLQAIGLITPFIQSSMVSRFVPLLQHPSGQVRHEIVSILARMDSPNIPNLLLPLLTDPDPHVKQAVIRFIGEHKPPHAAEKLIALIHGAPASLQEVICIALGQLQNPMAIPVLIKCLSDHTGFLSKKPLYEENVRVRAASALAGFLKDPQVAKALKKAAQDRNPLVRQTAEQVLRNPV
jgi:hypothetical protein